MTAQQLLSSNQAVRDAFVAYGAGKFPNIDQVIDKLGAAIWRDFQRSAQGKACSSFIDLSTYQVGKPTHVPTPERLPEAEEAESLERTCATCGATVPKTWIRGEVCLNCKKHAPAEKPVTVTLPQPTPVVKPTEPAMSSAEHGLLGMIAAGLKEMGFAPDKAVSAQRCEEIAFEQAQSVVEMVVEDLERQGKLGTKRTVIEVREPGQPVKSVEGYAPSWYPRLVKLFQCRVAALLVGPAGSGKTTAAKMLAQHMDLPFHRVSLAAGTDEGQLQGWLHPSSEGMRFEYVPSVVSHAYEHGGVVLLDDIDLGDANMLGIANAALDQAGWHIPLRHAKPAFEKHPDFYIMAAANTWGHGADRSYVGANQLDERTLSRLRAGQIRCDYDPVLETNLFGNHKVGAADSLAFGHRLRARLRAQPGQSRDVSTRDIETRWLMLDQFSVTEAWYGQFCDWSDEECHRVHAVVNHTTMSVELE